jgi:parallel beta-helix repeat protein
LKGSASATSLALVALVFQIGHARSPVVLTPGMVITRSVTIRPGAYTFPAPADLTGPAITIRGENITVDFNGAVLAGSSPDADPDTFAGIGVLIDGGSGVTVRNAKIRGYKVGILARRSPDLHLTRNDVSYNWKQRLYSGIEQESLVDWMSYHQNEKDEWLRYGAAICLSESDRAEVDYNTAVQGQNGLMVTRSSGLRIWNNTFQFLSSVGVGLYRVTKSTIMHNRIDWCVRGYSHGFYNRGQDSAGLLMYEQTSNNVVALNSITHGGDGLFLWAGQSTMDTGQGGSNDNRIEGNDFSHAPANGIEATFSRNTFIANRIDECWHGVWAGYSWDSKWINNRFARNTEGIAIEHGQNNEIDGNTFDGDETAIRLWQNAAQDPHWGYPKNRDTRSRDYSIEVNTFRNNKTALDVRDTVNVKVGLNRFESVSERARLTGTTDGFELRDRPIRLTDVGLVPPTRRLPGGIEPMIKDGQRRGRNTIIVDEWGPYDWKSPKLWPVAKPDEIPLRLRVSGPEGEWELASVRGAIVSPQNGRVPGEITVTPTTRAPVDFTVSLEYRGAPVTSPRGVVTPAGQPYKFEYSRFSMPMHWHLKFFEFGDTTDPVRQVDAFAKLLAGKPAKTLATDRLNYISGRSFEEGLPRDRFALVAETETTLPRGDYTLQVISDDGVRVWVDDVLTIDTWAPHESRVDTAPVSGGRRRLKVLYYEADGFAELRVDVRPRAARGAR